MKILITGGTNFVSRAMANYYIKKGHTVYVLNRNTRPQEEGAILIQADRQRLGNSLKKYSFDVVLDITAYTKEDVRSLLESVNDVGDYVLISSSAVYPDHLPQPFREEQSIGYNTVWKDYGINKCQAEEYLLSKFPGAYILRPPYLYGKMQNLYREPFVFDCAMANRAFYLPKDGKLPLQFFDVEDLCRFTEILLEKSPDRRIYNVGNENCVTAEEWVRLCYKVCGKEPEIFYVDEEIMQRNYFPFYDYAYRLDVSAQKRLMPQTKNLQDGLRESLIWYLKYPDRVIRRAYRDFIENNLIKKYR